jgi:uncharacterized protein GlcG (DUF336 family)
MFGSNNNVAMSRTAGVTLASALVVVDAARQQAEKIGVPMNIAVVDAGANLVAFIRMDGAWLGSIEIACNKAYTARAFDMTTRDLSKISQPGAPAYGIADSTEHKVAIFPGGIPLRIGKSVVGAVGASGGLPDQDHQVAQAGVDAFRPDEANGN